MVARRSWPNTGGGVAGFCARGGNRREILRCAQDDGQRRVVRQERSAAEPGAPAPGKRGRRGKTQVERCENRGARYKTTPGLKAAATKAWPAGSAGGAIEERSFAARGAPQDDGQGRVVRQERSAAEPDAPAPGKRGRRGKTRAHRQNAKGNSHAAKPRRAIQNAFAARRRPLQKRVRLGATFRLDLQKISRCRMMGCFAEVICVVRRTGSDHRTTYGRAGFPLTHFAARGARFDASRFTGGSRCGGMGDDWRATKI